MNFKLDSTLEKDSIFIMGLTLCQVRLINNADYPWIILVPQLPNITEITDLDTENYNLLNKEIKSVAKALQNGFQPDKLNIAMIGNMVRQLHVHVIARYKNDKLFPKPVWGCEFVPYDEKTLKDRVENLKEYCRLL
jgi:diadenosine tetraphosphate (Ap4A) HIT family hydrolase